MSFGGKADMPSCTAHVCCVKDMPLHCTCLLMTQRHGPIGTAARLSADEAFESVGPMPPIGTSARPPLRLAAIGVTADK